MTRQLEKRLITEFLFDKYPLSLQWKRVRLGQVPTQEMAAAMKVTLNWADAIVLSGNEIVIIEAKMRPDSGAFGQLEHYRELFKLTPEFSKYWNNPIRLEFVTTRLDENLKATADSKSITYEIWRPDWVIKEEERIFRLK